MLNIWENYDIINLYKKEILSRSDINYNPDLIDEIRLSSRKTKSLIFADTAQNKLTIAHLIINQIVKPTLMTMSNSIYKQKLSPIKPGDPIDYKDVDLLKKFITDRGKILPRRLTGLTAKQQRDLTTAVKRARIIALLPFVNPEG